jgi:transposase
MRLLKVHPYLTNKELYQKLYQRSNIHDFRDWQIIYSVQTNPGILAKEIGRILGVSIHKIYRVIEAYNREGPNWKEGKQWGGRRNATSYLTLEEESGLMGNLEEKAKVGQILTAMDIKEEVEKKIGRKVSDDYIWDLFKRHGWKKKAPRPKHPKSNREAQENYKKNSKRIWLP